MQALKMSKSIEYTLFLFKLENRKKRTNKSEYSKFYAKLELTRCLTEQNTNNVRAEDVGCCLSRSVRYKIELEKLFVIVKPKTKKKIDKNDEKAQKESDIEEAFRKMKLNIYDF